MTTIYFQELMEDSFGCVCIGRVAMGAANGFPYSAQLVSPGNSPEILFHFAVASSARHAAAMLEEKKLEHMEWFSEKDGQGGILAARLKLPSDFYAKSDISTIITNAQDAFILENLSPVEECPLCGLKDCDEFAYVNGEYRKTHADCLAAKLSLQEKDITPPKKVKGFVLLGILGAMAGALLGALPNWALALGQGRVHWVLYAFIPIFSALLYRLFRGKANRNIAGLSVLVCSVVAALVLEQIWFWLYQTTLTGQEMSIKQASEIYFRTHNVGITISEMWASFLALVLGMLPAAALIRHYVQGGVVQPKIIRGSKFVRESAQPINPEEDDAGAAQEAPEETAEAVSDESEYETETETETETKDESPKAGVGIDAPKEN